LSDLGFRTSGRSPQVVHSGDTSFGPSLMAKATLPAPDLGELTVLLPLRRLHPGSPRTLANCRRRGSGHLAADPLAGPPAEVDVGLLQEPFGFSDAAGHRSVGVHQTCALGVFSGEQKATVQRLAEQVRVGGGRSGWNV
jgi:hypothetical protein